MLIIKTNYKYPSIEFVHTYLDREPMNANLKSISSGFIRLCQGSDTYIGGWGLRKDICIKKGSLVFFKRSIILINKFFWLIDYL